MYRSVERTLWHRIATLAAVVLLDVFVAVIVVPIASEVYPDDQAGCLHNSLKYIPRLEIALLGAAVTGNLIGVLVGHPIRSTVSAISAALFGLYFGIAFAPEFIAQWIVRARYLLLLLMY